MRTIAKIQSIFRKEVGDKVFQELVDLYPPGDTRPQHHVFDCELPLDDPRTRRVMDRLSRAGFHPWVETSRPMDDKHEYMFELEREYEPADLVDCQRLELDFEDGSDYPEADSRSLDGGINLRDFLPYLAEFDFMRGETYWYIVPERVKKILESGDLVGVQFRRTNYLPTGTRADDTDEILRARHGDPFWELDSNRRMPPLSPSMVLIDHEGRRVPHGYKGLCFPQREDLYVHTELHYRQSDVAKMEPVDLARTFEQFDGFGAPGDRPLIASQRFYRFCQEHGLKAKWIPVRIDPD